MALWQAQCVFLVFVLMWSISERISMQRNMNLSGGGSTPQTMPIHMVVRKYAISKMSRAAPDFYGISAVLNVWMPKTESYDASIAQVWIANNIFQDGTVETIEAGWMVYPSSFEHTNEPLLFAFYTTDNYTRTLCYNVDPKCKFVSFGGKFIPGKRLPYSIKGRDQVEIKTEIKLDVKAKRWLYRANDTEVGYWPTEVFKGLMKGANILDWGGEVIESRVSHHPTTTEVGSGSFPSAGDKRAAHFNDIFYIDAKGNKVPPSRNQVLIKVTDPGCYSMNITEGQPPIYYFGGYGGLSRDCKRRMMVT